MDSAFLKQSFGIDTSSISDFLNRLGDVDDELEHDVVDEAGIQLLK